MRTLNITKVKQLKNEYYSVITNDDIERNVGIALHDNGLNGVFRVVRVYPSKTHERKVIIQRKSLCQ